MVAPPTSPAVVARYAETMQQQRIYREGRCRMCLRRVTVDRENDGHTRDGVWCGPVETEKPFELVPDDPPPCAWVYAPGGLPCDV